MSKFVYGIDIGGTSIKIGLFSLSGTLVNKWEIFTDLSDDGINILTDVYQSLKSNTIALDDVVGYGFGIPGPVVNGVVSSAVNLGWLNKDIKKELSPLLNNDNIFLINDANAAALGESWQGAAVGYSNSIMITLGTGVGGGIIVNNKVVTGVTGSAGEIGHMKLKEKDGIICNCGGEGCLETLASATGIRRNFCRRLKDSNLESSISCFDNPSAKMIFDAAKNGDEAALLVVEDVSYYLAYAIQLLAVVVNPGIVLIGGGVANAGDFLIDRIIEKYNKIAFSATKDLIIQSSMLGNDAGIYGAASLVIKND